MKRKHAGTLVEGRQQGFRRRHWERPGQAERAAVKGPRGSSIKGCGRLAARPARPGRTGKGDTRTVQEGREDRAQAHVAMDGRSQVGPRRTLPSEQITGWQRWKGRTLSSGEGNQHTGQEVGDAQQAMEEAQYQPYLLSRQPAQIRQRSSGEDKHEKNP